jgi:pyridoxine 4-dehydrogenase
VGTPRQGPVLDYCTAEGIAFIPWYPIGGGEMNGEDVLQAVADDHDATPRQVALSWLLHHADNILLIPGTADLDHLEANMVANELVLSTDETSRLDAIADPKAR